MTARVLRPAITFATVSAVLLAVLAVYLTFAASPSNVEADAGHYDATNTQTVASAVPGAARASTTSLIIPGPDANFSDNVTFEPANATFTLGCNKDGPDGGTELDYRDLNNDAVIDAGETPCLVRGNAAGTQTSDVFLGIANSVCGPPNSLTVIHDLYLIANPNNELSPRLSTNIVFPHVEGASNRFQRWRLGGTPLGANGSGQTPGLEEEVIDAGSDTKADAGSFFIQNYPSYLLDLFDPDFTPALDGPLDPVLPLALYGGNTQVAGTWVPLFYAVFDKGALAAGFAGTEPSNFSKMTAALGYPTQAVLNDPTALKANASSITDFCTPLTAVNSLLATVGGVTRATNPSTPGTHLTLNYSAGQRDADNDGYENTFDTCPKNANIDDGRTDQGDDQDAFGFSAPDMLDPACDPSPIGWNSATNGNDHDNDGFPNAQDICPLVSDPLQIQDENAGGAPGQDVSAIDGGPAADGLGNACDGPASPEDQYWVGECAADDHDDDGDGATFINDGCPAVGPAEAGANCSNAVDNDGDSIVNDGCPANGPAERVAICVNAIDNDGDASVNDGCPAVGPAEAGGSCAGAADDDADGVVNDGCPAVGGTSIVVTINGQSVTVTFAAGVGNGHWHNRMSVMAKCYSTGVVDADGDGYCATGTVGCTGACVVDSADSGACTGAVPPNCTVRHAAWTTASLSATQNFDTDRGGGDTTTAGDPGGISPFIACAGGLTDVCPEAGFDFDAIESYTGTSPAQACAEDTTANNEPLDSWIYDVNDDTRANLSDVSILGGAPYGKFVNQAGGSVRYDLNADGITNLSDVSILGGAPYGKQCRRDDGTFGQPQ